MITYDGEEKDVKEYTLEDATIKDYRSFLNDTFYKRLSRYKDILKG